MRLIATPALSRAGLTPELLASMMQDMSLWPHGLDDWLRRARREKVRDVMMPCVEHVEDDATLGDAVHALIAHDTLSLPVMEKGRPIGILRLADVFTAVAELLLTAAEEAPQPPPS